jgi:hypothetical protein
MKFSLLVFASKAEELLCVTACFHFAAFMQESNSHDSADLKRWILLASSAAVK